MKRKGLELKLRKWGNIAFWIYLGVGFLYVCVNLLTMWNYFETMKSLTRLGENDLTYKIKLTQCIQTAFYTLISFLSWGIFGILTRLVMQALATLVERNGNEDVPIKEDRAEIAKDESL